MLTQNVTLFLFDEDQNNLIVSSLLGDKNEIPSFIVSLVCLLA